MLFPSTIFIFLFLPLVLFFYYIPFKKSRILQNFLLLTASLFFYAWGEPWFVLIMILSIVFNWFMGILIDKYRANKTKAKFMIIICISINISILILFKYLNFIISNLNYLIGESINPVPVTLPIGISFFTFQALSYVIDVYRNKVCVQIKPFNVGLYVALFPQLIAGPIVRYETIANQIDYRVENFDTFSEGVSRFILGLGKKVLIANNLAIIADESFGSVANGDHISMAMAWLGAIAYTLQIYFDFSGYSDMAIGLGKMFGFHFLENFNYPYISRSITEFWRRWHISLSTWFRDYVYFPLGGSRVESKHKLISNLFIVWLLTGIWHGANFTFIVWGLMHFVLISCEKLSKKENNGHFYTMLFVIIGWVIFRSNSLFDASEYLFQMFNILSETIIDDKFFLYINEFKYYLFAGILFSTPVKSYMSKYINLFPYIGELLGIILMIIVFIFSISFIVKNTYSPFIYFNF